MDKRKLEQIAPLRKELKDIEMRLHRLENQTTIDGVRGSGKEFPYTEHTFRIEGINHKGRNYLKRRFVRCRNQIQMSIKYIEECLDNIDDSELRQIIRYKFEDGLDYNVIAHKMNDGKRNGNYTADSVRMKVKRFLKNF
jgi:hypothetical protein